MERARVHPRRLVVQPGDRLRRARRQLLLQRRDGVERQLLGVGSDQAGRAALRARRRRQHRVRQGRGQLLRRHQQAGGQPDRAAGLLRGERRCQSCFTVPACFLRQQLDDCATQVVNVRHAFAKISPKHDYQPRNWDGLQMNLFGIWDVGLEPPHLQPPVRRDQHRHQAPRGALQLVAEVVPGRRQDADPVQPAPAADDPVLRGVVARAVPARAVRRRASRSSRQWNDAVKCAAADAMGIDDVGQPVRSDADQAGHLRVVPQPGADRRRPRRVQGGPRSRSSTRKGNVVLGDDGNPILRARQGDPRRSTIFWVNEQQNAGPLGYGPPLFDIETGETISGQAYIYGAALDTYAARSRDLVRADPRQPVARGLRRRHQHQGLGGVEPGGRVEPAGDASRPTRVRSMYKAMDFTWARGQAPEAPIDTSSPTAFMQSWKNREDAMYKSNLWGQSQADLPQVRRDKLKGGQLEAMMITPDIMAMGGAAPATDWTSLSEAEKIRVSPLRSQAVRAGDQRAHGHDARVRRRLRRLRRRGRGAARAAARQRPEHPEHGSGGDPAAAAQGHLPRR